MTHGERLARGLAWLLELGTWAASLVVSIGLCWPHTHLVRAGVASFVALPVVRVVVTFVVFLRRRDWRLAALVGCVLVALVAGVALGLRAAGGAASVGSS